MLFPEEDANAHYIERQAEDALLGSCSSHAFRLEGVEWPSVEHYFQAMKFQTTDPEYMEKIRLAKHPKAARRLGRKHSRKLRKDWKQVKKIVMTRAVYTKCKAHPEVASALLETGDDRLVNNQQYDYFWGCGRDRRGENTYGKVLMDVRNKLREEALEAVSSNSVV